MKSKNDNTKHTRVVSLFQQFIDKFNDEICATISTIHKTNISLIIKNMCNCICVHRSHDPTGMILIYDKRIAKYIRINFMYDSDYDMFYFDSSPLQDSRPLRITIENFAIALNISNSAREFLKAAKTMNIQAR